MDSITNLEEEISKLRNVIDALGGQILKMSDRDRAAAEACQQQLMSDLKVLEDDPRLKVQ
jgi:hypothetical protein